MKFIVEDMPHFVPKNIYDECNLQEQKEWVMYFEDVVKHERFFAYCNDTKNVSTIYDMIDIL